MPDTIWATRAGFLEEVTVITNPDKWLGSGQMTTGQGVSQAVEATSRKDAGMQHRLMPLSNTGRAGIWPACHTKNGRDWAGHVCPQTHSRSPIRPSWPGLLPKISSG